MHTVCDLLYFVTTQVYKKPLKVQLQQSNVVLDRDQIQKLFGPIKLILQHHELFYAALSEQTRDWSPSKDIGAIFHASVRIFCMCSIQGCGNIDLTCGHFDLFSPPLSCSPYTLYTVQFQFTRRFMGQCLVWLTVSMTDCFHTTGHSLDLVLHDWLVSTTLHVSFHSDDQYNY